METRPRVLCVDDEQLVLDGLTRTLRSRFEVVTASSGGIALGILHDQAPFAVIVSDMRMPGMDGVAFLGEAIRVAPDSVRVLLTGQADLASAAEAVNRGGLFRFLLKPASHEDLTTALDAAAAQHELVNAERVLLEQTLQGAVSALVDALALANPLAFSRVSRIGRIVQTMLQRVDAPDGWSVQVATALSQLGAVALPQEVMVKLDHGEELTSSEQDLVARVPALTDQLLQSIPRLEGVRSAIRLQTKRFDGGGPPDESVAGDQIPLAARMLRIAVDLDQLESQSFRRDAALTSMSYRRGIYDPGLLTLLRDSLNQQDTSEADRYEVDINGLRAGMVIAADIIDNDGSLLAGRGHNVTTGLIARLANRADRVKLPILVAGKPPRMGQHAEAASATSR
jgi:response regulator RpfG family c-di-GMP phosphodiesterase